MRIRQRAPEFFFFSFKLHLHTRWGFRCRKEAIHRQLYVVYWVLPKRPRRKWICVGALLHLAHCSIEKKISQPIFFRPTSHHTDLKNGGDEECRHVMWCLKNTPLGNRKKKKKGLNYSFWRKSTFQTHQKWQNNKISSTTMTEARAEPQTSEGKVFKSRFPNETPYAQLPSLWQSCAEIISLHWKREMFKNFHKLLSLRNSHATMLL